MAGHPVRVHIGLYRVTYNGYIRIQRDSGKWKILVLGLM